MEKRTALQVNILRHWLIHNPRMVMDLEKENSLGQALEDTESQTIDLLHDLISVKKMDYNIAWEVATFEWSFSPK